MIDPVVLPKQDWLDILNEARRVSGTTGQLRASEVAPLLADVFPQKATGTFTPASGASSVEVQGLLFRPKIVIIWMDSGYSTASTSTSTVIFAETGLTGNDRCILHNTSSALDVRSSYVGGGPVKISLRDDGFMPYILEFSTYQFYPKYSYIALG